VLLGIAVRGKSYRLHYVLEHAEESAQG
jgi:hypothetical protein